MSLRGGLPNRRFRTFLEIAGFLILLSVFNTIQRVIVGWFSGVKQHKPTRIDDGFHRHEAARRSVHVKAV